jgi:hypothetical protein
MLPETLSRRQEHELANAGNSPSVSPVWITKGRRNASKNWGWVSVGKNQIERAGRIANQNWIARERDHRQAIEVNPLELQQLAETLGLGPRHGNLGGALVVHLEHVTGLEPRHDFLDVVDIHQEGAMRAPEGIRIE